MSNGTQISNIREIPILEDELLELFREETEELFVEARKNTQKLQTNKFDAEILNALHRNIHTLKGAARLITYEAMADFIVEYESLLKAIIAEEADLLPIHLALTTKSVDVLEQFTQRLNKQRKVKFPMALVERIRSEKDKVFSKPLNQAKAMVFDEEKPTEQLFQPSTSRLPEKKIEVRSEFKTELTKAENQSGLEEETIKETIHNTYLQKLINRTPVFAIIIFIICLNILMLIGVVTTITIVALLSLGAIGTYLSYKRLDEFKKDSKIIITSLNFLPWGSLFALNYLIMSDSLSAILSIGLCLVIAALPFLEDNFGSSSN
ncbi:MAG: Hpt domain-containing protein [Pseudomonadota bacterium]